MAPPVFKTGLAGIAFAGRFDSFPPPPNSMCRWLTRISGSAANARPRRQNTD